MAAAEYYNASAAPTGPQQVPYQRPVYQQSPYQQSPYQRPQELHGSPVPQHNLASGPQTPPQHAPPPYRPVQEDGNQSVHFAQTTPPSQHSRPNSGRPSFSSPRPSSNQQQYLQPPPHHSPYPQYSSPNLTPQAAAQPPHMRPYMNTNPSEYSLNGGYASDPEQRRRKHKHKSGDRRDARESTREAGPRKNRSRSTNTDGFIGAAGGGLIGDLIFPGLGTVGGAVAGWLGGKDYGRHRKDREDKRSREQKDWEQKYRNRSGSGERKHGHDGRHDQRHNPRRSSDY